MAERGISFSLAHDPNLELATQYGVADLTNNIPYPATFIVDRDGFIRFVYIGEDMTDRPVLESITTIVKHLSP